MDWVANQDKKKTHSFTAICTATNVGGQFGQVLDFGLQKWGTVFFVF
jgi:hypothetical protein